MQPAPVSSFFKFLVGFLTFISVSFGVTFTVQTYATGGDVDEQQAAALSALLQQKNK